MAPTKDEKDQPKVPSDERDWAAMDIFVFSNGQQYSPPRKYHLRAEELNWWKATLGYIARSQYGAMYSTIELYSIDGVQITNPMELRDGAAYVAVVPPDAFIDAGYEKYIIKATKSWDKRQSRLKSVKRDSAASGQSNKSRVSIEIPEAKNHSDARDGSGSSQKNKPQGSSQQGSKYTSATLILKPRKRPYSGSNRTSILRRLNNEIRLSHDESKPAKRKEERSKDNDKFISPVVGNLSNRTKKGGPAANKTVARPKTPIKKPDASTPLHQTYPPSHDKPLIKKITEVPAPVPCPDIPAEKKESFANVERDYIPEETVVVVLSNDPKKQEDDLMYMFWNLHDDTEEKKLSECQIPNELTTIKAIKETQTQAKDIGVENQTRASSPIQKSFRNNYKTETDQGTQSEPMTNDEPFVTLTSDEDGINLKLYIELRDSGGVVSSVKANIVQRSHSLNDEGQENQKTIYIDDILKESNSMKSLSDCDCECSKKGNSNVYILQCTCDPQQITDKDGKICAKILGNAPKPKTYLIVVPIVSVVEKEGIRNRNAPKESAEKEVQNDNEIVTIVNFTDGGQQMFYFPRSHPLAIEYKPSIHQASADVFMVSSVRLLESDTGFKTIHQEEIAGTSSKPKNVASQTDWCSTVLEVRRHEDGHYTFHLPPLQLLRTYPNHL